MPDSEKLRRFSLLMALLLFSYSMAGVHIEQGEKILLLGIPFTVSNPELIPLGLVVASVYGLVRFYYYEVMLHATNIQCARHCTGRRPRPWNHLCQAAPSGPQKGIGS